MATIRKLISVGHSYVVGLNRRLAHELSREGKGRWEVTAVAPPYFHGTNDLRPITYETCQTGTEPCQVEIVPARLTRHVHLFTYSSPLKGLLRDGNWDLVHAWEEPYVLAGGQIAYLTPPKTALVYSTYQNLSKRYPPPFNWIERYSLHRASGWIAGGNTTAAALGKRVGYRQKPTRNIVMGVDVAAFTPDANAGQSVRQSLGWKESGPPVVGFLGRFTEAKGVRFLMRVFDELKSQGVEWRALFVGTGPLKSELEAWAAHHGDFARICTDVKHDAVPRYINAMQILAAPSLTTPRWREQFGRMTIEAFACGVPVIGSSSGEIPYVIDNAGIVAPEGDLQAWVTALQSLLNDSTRRAQLGAAGLERAQSCYSWQVVARRYLEFFDRIVESGRVQ